MTLYYVKQDKMWCCEQHSGPYNEDHEKSFVNCECKLMVGKMTAEHLQDCKGGGPVLKWREATDKEWAAYQSGWMDGLHDQSEDDCSWIEIGERNERERIIALLEAKGNLGNPEWKLNEIIALIKGENK